MAAGWRWLAAGAGWRLALAGCCLAAVGLTGPVPCPGPPPQVLLPRALGGSAALDDYLVLEGSGAYCSSMATKHYNSFPEAPEVMLSESGAAHLIRKRQPLPEIWANEVPYTPE